MYSSFTVFWILIQIASIFDNQMYINERVDVNPYCIPVVSI